MKPPDESWRLFVAIELPATLRSRLRDHIDRLRKAVPDARANWAREENLHLTLKFFGNTLVSSVEALSRAIERASKDVSPFELLVGRCGVFPSRGQPRVLWIGIEEQTDSLGKLFQSLEDECARSGFTREERPFRPHLTVARLRQTHDARRLGDVHKQLGFDPVSLNVRDVCLFKSELRKEGSRYTVIARHALAQ
ncbi:MAG: 2,3-cyclic 3-phosphodiesterase [Blastocatellia bacterium]|jgi:2'-5' RNA ligase|nr:2,3-cyclic 3-phosphodiesterase [Blastocatellia bacterium]